MSNESAPPIRDLPDEIEAGIDRLSQSAKNWGFATEAPGRKQMHGEAYDDLRRVILAALDDQDAALRERCERLRRIVQTEIDENNVLPSGRTPLVDAYEALQPGDLADNLRPRGGDAG